MLCHTIRIWLVGFTLKILEERNKYEMCLTVKTQNTSGTIGDAQRLVNTNLGSVLPTPIIYYTINNAPIYQKLGNVNSA